MAQTKIGYPRCGSHGCIRTRGDCKGRGAIRESYQRTSQHRGGLYAVWLCGAPAIAQAQFARLQTALQALIMRAGVVFLTGVVFYTTTLFVPLAVGVPDKLLPVRRQSAVA